MLRLWRYERISVQNRRFRSNGWPVNPKFQVDGVAPANHSFSQKTRLNDLSYGIKIWTNFSSVLSQCTRLTDRRTERQTEFSSLDRVCIPCSEVKMLHIAVAAQLYVTFSMMTYKPSSLTRSDWLIFWFMIKFISRPLHAALQVSTTCSGYDLRYPG